MIRLAIVVGFLSVFGFVAYAIVLLLTNHFNNNTPPQPPLETKNPPLTQDQLDFLNKLENDK